MSIAPYVAPWATGFTRYSTQQRLLTITAPTVAGITVTAGQWWRVITLATRFATLVGATRAYGILHVYDEVSHEVYSASTGSSYIDEDAGLMVLQIGGASVVNDTIASDKFGSAPLPDLLWPQGYRIEINLRGSGGRGSISQAPVMYVENYTEERPGELVPQAVEPTPLLV